MASKLPPSGVLFEVADVAPSPSKDYCQLAVTVDKVIYRWWKISRRSDAKHVTPSEIKDSYEEFLEHDRVQNEILRVFGKNVLEYVIQLAKGHLDYLPRLPTKLIINIIQFLELEDINRLSQVSKLFHEICSSDALWEKMYMMQSGTNMNPDLKRLAKEKGWKKLFFTNKLQIQLQLRRSKRKNSPEKEPSDKSSTSHLPAK